MIKRMIIMLALFAIVVSTVIAIKTYNGKKMMQGMMAGMHPPTISTVKVVSEDWQPKLNAVGTLRAVNGADLSSELAGIVQSINFESGSDVEKDTILVQLRDDDDIAKLHALEAANHIAEINYQRDLKEVKAQAIAQATVDADAATLDGAKAQVVAQQALIDKKTIKAPFTGHLGIRQVDVGQYLQPGTAIVTLQQLDPIYVDFSLPEQSLTHLTLGQKVRAHVDAQPDVTFEGEISAINAKIDEATRNILVRATFKNPDHKLLPGMFADTAVDVDKPVRYITLPQAAIVFNTYGNTVFLVQKKDGDTSDKPQLTVQQSVVVTGETRGDQIAVLSGIKDGDEVVTSGQVKLRNGMQVVVNNDTQPSNDPDPKPHEQ